MLSGKSEAERTRLPRERLGWREGERERGREGADGESLRGEGREGECLESQYAVLYRVLHHESNHADRLELPEPVDPVHGLQKRFG